MKLFSWFQKSSKQDKAILSRDLVWQSELAKYQALLKLLPTTEPLFFVSFFATEHQQLMQVFRQAGIAFSERQSPDDLASALVQVCLAKDLPSLPPTAAKYYFNSKHPLYEEEQKVLQKLPPNSHCFYVSFESAFMRIFVQERLKTLLQRMQIAGSDAIEHRLVSTSLQAAQKKVSKALASSLPMPALSEEAWLQQNYQGGNV